ncbi:hypothetical protein ARTSIC4J27_153 [Pseudarthrobacter siccitolerans]|uniref:Cyclase family protein n=1 Tax=Pseudarthrobacter siccitolerans TaxID=861266 RepID=A0A024GXK0_9MICC|nr:hypothetical protein ARTSIC4J27_153 [Pseudarthrobacter siccitolerans]
MNDERLGYEMSSELPDLPDYDELPKTDFGIGASWGMFGQSDEDGLLNLHGPATTLQAAQSIVTGEVIRLDVPLDFFDPPLYGRPRYTRDTVVTENGSVDESYSALNPQSSSQWDALSHVAAYPGKYYNGATLDEVLEGRNSIASWARRGIVGRGVLLDLQRDAELNGQPYDPGSPHAFSVADLERARQRAGVEFRRGDIILLRTGFAAWYADLGTDERQRISDRANMAAAGLEHTEEMARYLWNIHCSAIVSDTPCVEVFPMGHSSPESPFGILHRALLGHFGMAIGELWWLEELAARSHDDGRATCMLVSAPLYAPGGVGSMANALAIR